MNFIFQAAADAANKARKIANGYLGIAKLQPNEFVKPLLNVTVSVGYQLCANTDGEVKYGEIQVFDKVNKLMAQYLTAYIPEALEYACRNLEHQADTALKGSKAVLQEYLARIEALESAEEQTNV